MTGLVDMTTPRSRTVRRGKPVDIHARLWVTRWVLCTVRSGGWNAGQHALNESASCDSVSSEGRTAPTDTALVAHNPYLTTNRADTSMPVSKRTRYEVLRRDNHTCRYCGGSAPDAILTVDHVTPVALGGSDSPDNLVAACRDCNYGKASTSPSEGIVEDVKQVDIIWAKAIARAAEIRAGERDLEIAYVNAFENVWYRWRPDNFSDTLIQLRASGLPQAEMVDAALIALTNKGIEDRFRYFCGVSWRKVRNLQETAKGLIAAGELTEMEG